jgi:hypothetical protein
MRLAGNRAEVGECCAEMATQVKVKLRVAPIRKFNCHSVKRERMGSRREVFKSFPFGAFLSACSPARAH